MAQLALEIRDEMYVWEQPEVMALPICQAIDKSEVLQLQEPMLCAGAAQVEDSSSILSSPAVLIWTVQARPDYRL
jgi:hypothetical protein